MPRPKLSHDLPIRWQLAAFYTGLLVLILGALGLLLYWRMESFLLSDTEARLSGPIQASIQQQTSAWNDLSAAELTKLPKSVDQPSIDMALLKILASGLQGQFDTRDSQLSIYDSQGKQLSAGEEAPGAALLPAPPVKLLFRALDGRTGSVIEGQNPRVLVQLFPIRVQGRVLGVVSLRSSLAGLDAVLGALRLYLALGIGLALAAGVGIGVPVTRRLLRPLGRVALTAGEIANGDLSKRVGVSGERNEIGQVATAFDRMVGRLEMMLKTQRQFVADASHELRTPLTALSGMVEMLLLGIAEDDEAARQRVLRRMAGEIDRLNRLVGDLLDLSRLDSRPSLARQEVDLAALTHAVVAGLRHSYPDRIADCADGPAVIVQGDPDRLRQVVLNLVDNAFKYTQPGGHIDVRVEAGDGWAVLRVTDDGMGIAPENLPHIFDRFYRADPSRARKVGGVGLGLAIARAIVEGHGGTITAESPGPGQGTRFTAWLRLAPSLTLAGNGLPTAPSSARPGRPLRRSSADLTKT